MYDFAKGAAVPPGSTTSRLIIASLNLLNPGISLSRNLVTLSLTVFMALCAIPITSPKKLNNGASVATGYAKTSKVLPRADISPSVSIDKFFRVFSAVVSVVMPVLSSSAENVAVTNDFSRSATAASNSDRACLCSSLALMCLMVACSSFPPIAAARAKYAAVAPFTTGASSPNPAKKRSISIRTFRKAASMELSPRSVDSPPAIRAASFSKTFTAFAARSAGSTIPLLMASAIIWPRLPKIFSRSTAPSVTDRRRSKPSTLLSRFLAIADMSFDIFSRASF